MKKLLYIIRTEADFERVVCLGIAGKDKYEQHFVFVGDFSPFYSDGIQNNFQKELFNYYDFTIKDFCEYSFVGRILKKLAGNLSVSMQQFLENKSLLFFLTINALLRRYISANRKKIVKRVFQNVKPDVLFTDQSVTHPDYIPEIFRNTAIKMNIPVYIFTHGAACGLHG